MKRFFTILAGAVFVAALVFASCGSTEPANTNGSSEGGAPASAFSRPTNPKSTEPATTNGSSEGGAPASASSRQANPQKTYYSGGGGKGLSLAILTPEASGLSANEAYLATLVQGVLVEDFSKFSDMDVLDRQNLDKIIMEGESGAYPADSGFARFGELSPTQYVLSGSLAKTSLGYQLRMTVSDSKTAKTLAAYTGSASRDALDDFSAIKAASEDLLAQMGVDLTDAGKEALRGVDQKSRNVETALAKGVSAQRGGSTVAALTYYSTAASLNPGLAEAEQRLAALTREIKGGDIGEDIQRRSAWIQLLDEAKAFYQENPFYDLVYCVKPEIGRTDYNRNTRPVSYAVWLEPNTGYTALLTIIRALMGTGKDRDWGLTGNVTDLLKMGLGGFGGNSAGEMLLEAELLDEAGEYIGTLRGGASATVPTAPPHYDNHLPNATDPVLFSSSVFWNQPHFLYGDIDANRISGGMRVSGIRVMSNAEIRQNGILAGLRRGNDHRNTSIAIPFTGEFRIIPTEKNFHEYFRGKRDVEVSGDYANFTFR
jgi:hypothetical protein